MVDVSPTPSATRDTATAVNITNLASNHPHKHLTIRMNSLNTNQTTSTETTREYFAIIDKLEARNKDPRCGYPSKRCENPRAVKRTGDLHRFCEHHRHQANQNQRKRERRRQEQQMREQLPMEAYLQQLDEKLGIPAHEPPTEHLSQLDLDDEDLRVLASILSIDADDES
ncbi:hypothetical protein FI667_g12376, partial [Globisporangium splendens]